MSAAELEKDLVNAKEELELMAKKERESRVSLLMEPVLVSHAYRRSLDCLVTGGFGSPSLVRVPPVREMGQQLAVGCLLSSLTNFSSSSSESSLLSSLLWPRRRKSCRCRPQI